MTNVFEPIDLVGIKLNNHVIRAATDEGMGDIYGNPTEKLIKLYENLAKGGVGGIITGYMAVSKEGESIMPRMVMMDSDDRIESLTEVVNRVHEAGAPIIAQLAHCGRNGVGGKAFNVNKVSEDMIEQIIDDFTDAVIRAKKIGYDGVELHLAHGYFLSEMLSGHTNRRKDQWGGSTQNRTRIVKEIMTGIRKTLPDYPILVKVNGDEIYKNGIHPEEAAEIAKMLESYGVSAIEVSCGIDTKQMGPLKGEIPVDMVMQKYPVMKDLPKPIKAIVKPLLPSFMKEVKSEKKYNVPSAIKIKEVVEIPVIALGGIHDLEDIESTINQDGIDFVSMSRPLILEPGLINKYKEQKTKNAKCLGCNYCMVGICNDSLKCYYGKLPK